MKEKKKRKERSMKKELPLFSLFQILSTFFLKASSYEMTVENSKKKDSYFYSLEHASRKSMYYAMYSSDLPPYLEDPGRKTGINHNKSL